MKKQPSNEIKQKIQSYIKNKLDISNLIQDIDIRGLDLSGSIICTFNRPDDDYSGCNLSESVIGTEDKITNISNSKMLNCNFRNTIFKGTIWMRHCDARNSDFRGAYMVNLDYRFTNFEGCNLCSAVMRIGTKEGLGAILDENFMRDLSKYWQVNVTKRKE